MSTETCTRCGRPLIDGACPLGHPQRSVRRRRRRWKLPVFLLLLVLLLGAGAYAGLVWYPVEAAEEATGPTSERFAEAVEALRETVAAYPAEAGDAEALTSAAGVLETADQARTALSAAQIELEEREPVSIPVISARPPLRIAEQVHGRMGAFSTTALELVADLEAVSRYLTLLAPLLTGTENLETALGEPGTPQAVENAVAAARPIAEQLAADLRALSPPDEVGATHASLIAVVRGIQTGIDELERVGTDGRSPVVEAIVQDLVSQLETFRETAIAAPASALEAGLAEAITAVDATAQRVIEGLRELDRLGVDGLSVPEPLAEA